MKMYEDQNIAFVTLQTDSISHYTDKTASQRQVDIYGKFFKSFSSSLDSNLNFFRADRVFSNLTHVQKIGVVTLKRKLNRFFTDFLTQYPGVTMTVDDVNQFIERELKRPKLM